MITLVGLLAMPPMLEALGLKGRPVTLAGRLTGGGLWGVDRGSWPAIGPGEALAGVEVQGNAALARYAQVMNLRPVDWQGRQVLGVAGQGTTEGARPDPNLAAEIARQIIDAGDHPAEHLAWRLPMIAIWAASRLRARGRGHSGGDVVARRAGDAVRVIDRRPRFAGYFAVEERRLTHALHQGGHSAPMTREAFLMGDAAVLLPWDPGRDRVLVIEQFRFAPAMRGDPQPWLLEPIAGRVDAGETPEAAIGREAREEAGLDLRRLIHAFDAYPSPGAVCEFLFHYVGIADLPDGTAGIHGLDSESEDIRGHLMDRADLSAMVAAGRITNGPLIALSLWLDARAADLGVEPAPGPGGS